MVVLVLMVLVSLAVSVMIIVRLPADYLRAPPHAIRRVDRGLFFQIGMFLKNALGALLIVIGVLLSLPGMPGQGLLTLLVGILLLDFSGKQKLVRKMLSQPSVLKAVNRLRKRFAQPPLIIT